jgi:hypothetical protein
MVCLVVNSLITENQTRDMLRQALKVKSQQRQACKYLQTKSKQGIKKRRYDRI